VPVKPQVQEQVEPVQVMKGLKNSPLGDIEIMQSVIDAKLGREIQLDLRLRQHPDKLVSQACSCCCNAESLSGTLSFLHFVVNATLDNATYAFTRTSTPSSAIIRSLSSLSSSMIRISAPFFFHSSVLDVCRRASDITPDSRPRNPSDRNVLVRRVPRSPVAPATATIGFPEVGENEDSIPSRNCEELSMASQEPKAPIQHSRLLMYHPCQLLGNHSPVIGRRTPASLSPSNKKCAAIMQRCRRLSRQDHRPVTMNEDQI